jgi:hypothetical protein
LNSTRTIGCAGFTGNGCVGEYHSVGTVAFRHRAFLDAEHRFAGDAIEDEHVTALADVRQRRHCAAALPYVHEAADRRESRSQMS